MRYQVEWVCTNEKNSWLNDGNKQYIDFRRLWLPSQSILTIFLNFACLSFLKFNFLLGFLLFNYVQGFRNFNFSKILWDRAKIHIQCPRIPSVFSELKLLGILTVKIQNSLPWNAICKRNHRGQRRFRICLQVFPRLPSECRLLLLKLKELEN